MTFNLAIVNIPKKGAKTIIKINLRELSINKLERVTTRYTLELI